ncbi:MAG: chaperone modulator CbpM [Hyphomicrobiaceae bacterium]
MTMSETELLTRVTRVTAVRLERWVGLGWLRPGAAGSVRVFTAVDVSRCELICDLVDDMGLEEEAVPVVLGLMDQVYGLRRQLRELTEAVEEQSTDVRQAILARISQKGSGAA